MNDRGRFLLAFVPLWLASLGGLHQLAGVPVARGVEVLEAVRSERDWDVTVRVLPNANHILLECETGDRGEFPLLRGFAPGYLDLMTQWMRARARLQEAGDGPARER